jgi:hypothetical protein
MSLLSGADNTTIAASVDNPFNPGSAEITRRGVNRVDGNRRFGGDLASDTTSPGQYAALCRCQWRVKQQT